MGRAEKLLESMRRTKFGWNANDIEALYTGFGFEKQQGGSHVKYKHSGAQLSATVSRGSGELSPAYAKDAVTNIDALLAWQAAKDDCNE